MWFSSWQRLVGTTTLLLVTFFTEAKRQPKNMLPPSRKIFLVLFGTGIFGYSLQTLLFNFGLNQSSASQAGICQPLTAVFTTLFAIAFKVRPARSQLVRAESALISIVLSAHPSLRRRAGPSSAGFSWRC